MSIPSVLVICALIATVVVLGLGLRSMAKGGKYDQEHAERFMWERVALQGLVVLLLLAAGGENIHHIRHFCFSLSRLRLYAFVLIDRL
jgi:hypothetical protein